jgi:type IV fimbrial biogenesis protein FimT
MKKGKGLTLIELVVTLAVALILLTMGIPMFSSITANNRATTQTNSIVTALQVARSEAVKRGVEVSVCSKNSGSTACGGNNDWLNGMLVYEDLDEDGVYDNGTEDLLAVMDSFSGKPSVSGSASVIRFTVTGMADLTSEQTICVSQSGATGSTPFRVVRVSVTGVVRTERLAACP